MRMAVVENGVVTNVIEAEEGFDYGDGSLVVPAENAGINWTYENGVFMPPAPQPPVVPDAVPLDRARACLKLMPGPNGAGTMFDAADALVQASGNVVLIEFWERGEKVYRDSATLAMLADALGLTSAQVDAMFISAAGLQP